MAAKILIIDDEEKLRKNIQIFLELNEFEVVCAGDGAEGLKQLEAEKPDLIISDVMMPVMDGFTMLKEIRANPGYNDIVIIMLTAKESISDLYELEGANEFLPKPFEMNNLISLINKALAGA